jgi:parathyroid hormone receptor 1
LQQYAPVVEVLTKTGYVVSFVTLIVAFSIMLFIRKLHCARNILHMHLFASFILRAFTFFIYKTSFVYGLGLPSDLQTQNGSLYFNINSETNNWTCKFIISLWEYCITANYSWILMEGLYLHNLIFRALFADSSNSIKWYVIMGWGFPLVIIGFWIAAKLMVEDSLCWTTNENDEVFLIILIPTMISVLINLLLFVRISLVLYSKLRSPINEDSRRYQKWVKSTLVLVPLFGVHYALFLTLYYWIKTDKIVEVVWLFGDLLFGSFQGFFVAILYCFLNGEVKSEIQPHLYYFLTFLATNKYSKCLFPCRKKFLRFLDAECGAITWTYSFLDQLWAGHRSARLCLVARSTPTASSTGTASVDSTPSPRPARQLTRPKSTSARRGGTPSRTGTRNPSILHHRLPRRRSASSRTAPRAAPSRRSTKRVSGWSRMISNFFFVICRCLQVFGVHRRCLPDARSSVISKIFM